MVRVGVMVRVRDEVKVSVRFRSEIGNYACAISKLCITFCTLCRLTNCTVCIHNN